MSVAAELLIRDIADAMDRPVFFSEFGDGCPLLDERPNPPPRMARRPVGGIVRSAGLATFAPPLSVHRRREDCIRLAQPGNVIVDAVASDGPALLEAMETLAPNNIAALRVRGAGYVPPVLKVIYQSPTSADAIFLRRDLVTDQLMSRVAALEAGEQDEFDALARIVGQSGVITNLRHSARQSEILLNPTSTLDQPDAGQIAAALAESRAIMAVDGGCALSIPQISGAPASVGIVVEGLNPETPDPTISLPNAPLWSLETERVEGRWRAVAFPPSGAQTLVSVFAEVMAHEADAAEITEVSTTITRTRGAWEIWDEAQQQLELEESW